jgi:uncharacterized protein YjbJ (UPF0337 family)
MPDILIVPQRIDFPHPRGSKQSIEVPMKTQSEHGTTQSKQDATDPIQKAVSTPIKAETVVEPSPATGDPTSEPAPEPNVETPITAVNSKDAANSAPLAAKGNDEVMSQPPPPKATVTDIKSDIQTKWKKHVGAAKKLWAKISEEDLLKTEGNEHKLATLVQNRHDMARAEAYKQVNDFFKKQAA